ncbi:MATH/TRAF domain [Arabidopsis thaliana x Arabidopsis arenosa]|uniref:MATH/TRAF domain n=1 Tax=Arabidopsis thaliana x Arabidopsis arenosa TaxID=1240361 RepID=A0A8T2A666_9BRAS|nr:MATH/TRAF domain [Arabidopsis thaliana x Arabidopsis arenosa]
MSSTTVQSLRERSPSSYSLKIKNFSQLENLALGSADGKYLSRLFSAGGYNWRMILYPKGNAKDNGSDFISMYVELDSSSLSTPSSEVFADFRFFVLNKKENKYLIIHDVESKPFNTFRSVWGLPQVLPLSTFKDPENGYVCLGQCEFGVDVIVAPPPTNWEILSFDEKLAYPKISWSVKIFFEMIGHCHTSHTFSVEGRTWAIELYPKGSKTEDYNKWVSIFLTAADFETLEEDEKIFTQAHLRILDPRGSNHLSRSITRCFDKSNSWGYSRFVSIGELKNTYLDMEGALTLEIQFDVVSTTKHSLP